MTVANTRNNAGTVDRRSRRNDGAETTGGTMRANAVAWSAIAALLSAFVAAGFAGAEAIEGRLKIIQDSATLRIAHRTDSRPFAFLDSEGRPVGYTIELCERIAESLKSELDIPALRIEWVPVDTRTRFDVIVNGAADLECGSTTASLSRMKIVDFSTLIFAETTGVLTRSDAGLFRFDDMAGRRIGVVTSSTNAQAVRDQMRQRRMQAELIEFRDREAGLAALVRGDVDGFATDKLVLLALAQAAKLRDFSVLPDDLSFEPFAIVLPRGDFAFRLAVNTGIARVFRSGEVIELYTKYFSGIAQRPSVWLGAVFTFGALPE
jgi:glutamate/aspartate transport system substrate-binding protein